MANEDVKNTQKEEDVKFWDGKKWEPWQKRFLGFWLTSLILGGLIFVVFVSNLLYKDKVAEEDYWNYYLQESTENQAQIDEISKDAVVVTTGTYVENMKEMNIKSSNYRVVTKLWFKWDANEDLDMIHNFEIYNGTINKIEVLEDKVYDGIRYQCARVDVTVSKAFWTRRFPLESHQLRFYVEPLYRVQKVKLVADPDSGVNPGLSLAGYEFKRASNAIFNQQYDSSYGDDTITGDLITSEYVCQMEFNRNGFGLYFKCFIALFGTSLWVFITMFLCTYHNVDPLSMIPAALFGTVSNIMVGANLLPDALDMGLLEFVNIWGVFTILSGALTIISINRIRNKHKDLDFAYKFGRVMFFSLLTLIVAGHIAMPVCSYIF